jgi:hypothetical protein
MSFLIRHLVLDLSFPSEARGSGFTTSTTLARLASSKVFRVITISRTYSWEVLVRCGPPPVPVDPRAPPPAPPVVPPGWGDAIWNWPPASTSRIDFFIIPARNPTHPSMLACLTEVTSYFSQHDIVSDHMSSDAGLDYADGLPHLVFSASEIPVDNCTACVMVATFDFFPLSIPPVIITGICRIPHINPFLGELIWGLAMTYLRSFYLHPIAGDMDCESVTRLQDQQQELTPEQSQSQGRVYGLILRAFLRGKGRMQYGKSHPEKPRAATATRSGRPAIPQSRWTRRNWLNHLADRFASLDPEATADHEERNLRPGKISLGGYERGLILLLV